MGMTKLLMVAPQIDLSSSRGGAIHQNELISALRAKNQVAVIAQGGKRTVSLGAKPQPMLTAIAFLKALSCARKFDVIHDRGYLLGGAGVFAGWLRNVPTILQVDDNWIEGDKASGHRIWKIGLYATFARFWIRRFVKKADAIVAVSSSLKDVAVKEWGANPEKVFVVGNGVNLRKFNPQTKQMRSELGVDKNAKVLTFVGEMAPWHGILETIKAAELVLENRRDCIFLLAGGVKTHERYMLRLKEYVNAKGLGGNIRFLGSIPYEKVPALLASSDVLLAPYVQPKSINFGFSPLKLFEYMAMKKPIVTSDLPWILEILSEKEACLLKDPGDSKEFSEKIIRLLDEKKYAKRMANSSRKLAVGKYSWENIAVSMELVYRTVLK